MKRLAVLSLIILFLIPVPSSGQEPVVLLISIDGFRSDYLENTTCPTLRRIAAEGVKASWMQPIFPTKTFPNHYSIVTGLYADHHGVVGNTMYDPEFDAWFSLSRKEEVANGRWWGGEPIWVTAVKQGRRTASYFWPGSEAEIGGVRPTYWMRYDGSVPYATRVSTVLQWLDEPREQRPSLITLYFQGVDQAGHAYGPDFSAVDTAVRSVDSALKQLVDGIEARSLRDSVNLIIVSDHGMSPVARERTVWLDDYIGLDTVRIGDQGQIVPIWATEHQVEPVYEALKGAHHAMKVYRKQDLPERWHYRDHRRIAPITLVAEDEWSISRRSTGRWRTSDHGGGHGYDNTLPSMRAIFIARGPSFRKGALLEPFENVHVYSLLAHLLKLRPAATDGTLSPFTDVLQ